MKVAIIKYNAGNVQSVRYALQRLGIEPILTDDPDEIISADKVIFPGVGNAATAMKYLEERDLHKVIPSLKQPVLGICLGLQLLCSFSEEGNTTCLGIFNSVVKLFKPLSGAVEGAPLVKVPQVGWNTIYDLKHSASSVHDTPNKNSLFTSLAPGTYIYYVHSYYAETGPDTIATTDYILSYSAALQKNNYYAVQFHPEKSGKQGERILKNFLTL